MGEVYEGPVCYVGDAHEAADGRPLEAGWHYTVVPDPSGEGEMPGEKLFLADDGTYRLAADGDESWHDRKHQTFATFQLEDSAEAERVNPEEFAAIKELLARMRGGQEGGGTQ
jgi:hypothetical protein